MIDGSCLLLMNVGVTVKDMVFGFLDISIVFQSNIIHDIRKAY